MSLNVDVAFDSRRLDVFLTKLNRQTMQRVIAKSLNRTATTVRKEATKTVRLGLKLPAKEIKEGLPIKRKARPSEPIDKQVVEIGASRKSISLRKFKPRQIRKGVRVNITGRAQVVESAFMARMANASEAGVFRRKRVRDPNVRIRRGRNKAELPIEKLAYKSLARILPNHVKQLSVIASRRFAQEFQSNYKHLLRR